MNVEEHRTALRENEKHYDIMKDDLKKQLEEMEQDIAEERHRLKISEEIVQHCLIVDDNDERKTVISPDIECDMWSQLKPVSVPVFSGDKSRYQSWKSVFVACIDDAPATNVYKLLWLHDCLTGDALQTMRD